MININILYQTARIKQTDDVCVKQNEQYIHEMSAFISNLPELDLLKSANIQKLQPYILQRDSRVSQFHTMSFDEVFLNAEEVNQYVLCRKQNI